MSRVLLHENVGSRYWELSISTKLAFGIEMGDQDEGRPWTVHLGPFEIWTVAP